MTRRSVKCFISAPFGVDTRPLRDELEKQGVEWADTTNAPRATSLTESIRAAIESSNFVCVVLPASQPSQNALIEAGIAIGVGKPLFVIADRSVTLPFDLAGVKVVLANVTDREALRFQLDMFMDTLTLKKRPERPSPAARSTTTRIKSSRRGFQSLAESEVAKLFEKAGFLLVEAKSTNAYEVDLAVWVDDIRPVFGSPVLPVEVKSVLRRSEVMNVVERVALYARNVGAGAGLIVYSKKEGESKQSGEMQGFLRDAFVFVISIRALRRVLGDRTFSEELRDLRNRVVHGT